jgi:hypothetical protein
MVSKGTGHGALDYEKCSGFKPTPIFYYLNNWLIIKDILIGCNINAILPLTIAPLRVFRTCRWGGFMTLIKGGGGRGLLSTE